MFRCTGKNVDESLIPTRGLQVFCGKSAFVKSSVAQFRSTLRGIVLKFLETCFRYPISSKSLVVVSDVKRLVKKIPC